MDPDVKLVLGTDDDGSAVEILACHQILAQASPFFRAMLSPGRFEEGDILQKNKYIKIPLPDTHPGAMEVICNIIHLRSSLVPTSNLTSELLVEIAILVDMLDCAEAVQPWSQQWMERNDIKHEMAAIEGMSLQDLSKWIFVCHALGYSERTEKHISQLTVHMGAEDLAHDRNKYIDHVPQLLIQEIEAKRSKVAGDFLEIAMHLEQSLKQGKSCRHQKTNADADDWSLLLVSDEEAFHCSSILLGNASLALRDTLGEAWRSGPWPGSIASMYRSLCVIADKLTGPSWITRDYSKKKKRTHVECNMNKTFLAQVDRIMGGYHLSIANVVVSSTAMD